MKIRACLSICSPLGRSLKDGLKSPKDPPFTSQKPGSAPCSSGFLPIQDLGFVKLLSLSSRNSFYRDPAVHALAQRCSSMARASDPAPSPPALSSPSPPRLALRHHAEAHPPTLSPRWTGCCAVESRPLMGSLGEREKEGGESS